MGLGIALYEDLPIERTAIWFSDKARKILGVMRMDPSCPKIKG